MNAPSPRPSPADAGEGAKPPIDSFFELLERALAQQRFVKLVLAKYRGAEADLVRVSVRPVLLQSEPCLTFVSNYKTRDITKNLPLDAGLAHLRALAGEAFAHAHLVTATEEIELRVSRRGRQTLHRLAAAATEPAAPAPHDRAKHRWLDIRTPFLAELGVTDGQGKLIPAMARKWKQINKFVEVLAHALEAAGLPGPGPLRVLDFGSGKGYLTFALHEHLRYTPGLELRVTGVELRADLVGLCNAAAQRLALEGIAFEQGDVRSGGARAVDVMIALHACDTATDHAIHSGVRGGARVIVCSPCCHKQLRPQLLSPHPLRPILRHGVHLGQEAEMLTDGLRALLLEANGYDTQVFEFVSLEHTNKNKMILAVKRERPVAPDAVLAQIAEIKAFYGIREHCLETLLATELTGIRV